MTNVITPDRAHGIDISKYDLTFDPSKAVNQLDFVVQRASYRTTKDEGFDTLNPGVQQVPIRLAYHYLNSGTPWKSQADLFLSVVNGKNFHAYVCDFEMTANTLTTAFAKEAWDFVKYVAIQTGKRCLIYTNKYHYQDYLVPSQNIYNINWNIADLWIAQYPDNTPPIDTNVNSGNPEMPVGRTSGWSMWQYTSKGNGLEYGTGRATACDLDVFNGSVDDMKTWLGINTPTPPPTRPNPVADFSLTIDGIVYGAKDVELTPQ